MARRGKKGGGLAEVGWLIFAIAFIGGVAQVAAKEVPWLIASIPYVLLAGAFALCLWLFGLLHSRYWYRKTLRSLIASHAEALGRKRRQLVTADAYGKEDTRRWSREMARFIEAVLVAEMGQEAATRIKRERDLIIGMIDEAARNASVAMPAMETTRPPTTKEVGDEFEVLCADVLTRAGWAVRRVGGSGDQGCDLLAERDTIRVALQCKRYSGPVGNAAVQEIVAARDYEEADYGAVVTNSRYTDAASRLAQKTGVLLLHQDDLPNLARLIAEAA